MKVFTSPGAACLALLFVFPCRAGDEKVPASGPAAVKGRLLDGSAMARSYRPDPAAAHAHEPPLAGLARVPLPDRKFRLQMIAGPEQGRTWEVASDSEGRFALDLGLTGIPQGPCLVAIADGPRSLYSPAVSWSREEIEFRLYPTTESPRGLQAEVSIFHSIAKDEGAAELEVLFQIFIQNSTGDLYVGRPRLAKSGAGGGSREIFRVPLPADAVVDRNNGPSGARWTEYPRDGSWKWMAIDTPIAPLIEDPQGTGLWEFRYRTRARQASEIIYPVSLNLLQFSAWGAGSDVKIESEMLPGRTRQNLSDPSRPDRKPIDWSVVFARDVSHGRSLPVTLRIDNAVLGQVNRDSLLILCGFILLAVLSIAAGLLISRTEPSIESILEEASGDEIVARIAQLDARFERGEIPEADYRATRARLLAMARYAVGELGPAEGPGKEGAPPR